MHEGRVVGSSRHPRPPGRGRVVDRRARPRARAPDRRPLPRAAPVDRAVARARAGREGRGSPRHLRVHAATPRAHRRVLRGLRSGLQDEPAAARAAPTSTRCAAGLADGTIDAIATDHAPHAPETKDVPFEEAPPGHARRRDRARGRAHDARRDRACSRSRRRSPRCPGNPARIAGLDAAGHGGPIAPGAVRAPVRVRSRRSSGSSTRHRLASRSVTRPGTAGSSPARCATRSSPARRPCATGA